MSSEAVVRKGVDAVDVFDFGTTGVATADPRVAIVPTAA